MFNLSMKSADKSGLSLPKPQNVCGYEIKKMPVGAYLTAINRIQDLPADFMNRCFPGMGLQDIIDTVSTADENTLVELITGLMVTVPEYLISFLADLTGIAEDSLRNDENIGLDGLLAIIRAFIEVNGLGKLIGEASGIKESLTSLFPTKTEATGSSD